MAIVTAMSSGTIPLCLLGSFLIYKEKLTCFQINGSILCFAGILVLAFSVTLTEKKDVVEMTHVDNENGKLRIMLINSFLSMILLSTKMNMAKYCSRILSRFTFIKIYFIGEFICAAIIIVLSLASLINVPS